VQELIDPGRTVTVIEDGGHTHDTTLSALRALSPLVPQGGWFVVEDTCVDVEALRAGPDWPRGAGLALTEWLEHDEDGRRFERRLDTERYGITCHPGGFLRRHTAFG